MINVIKRFSIENSKELNTKLIQDIKHYAESFILYLSGKDYDRCLQRLITLKDTFKNFCILNGVVIDHNILEINIYIRPTQQQINEWLKIKDYILKVID